VTCILILFIFIKNQYHITMDYNAIFWKSKAVQRNAENKELKKRIKEIKKGRESWKVKYKLKSEEALKYKNELDLIKKKIVKILK
jgi:hypothetical protein